MDRFSPPARVDDFARSGKAEELAAGWDAVIDHWLTNAADGADGRFHNPRRPGAPAGGSEAPIAWDAFPQVIKRWFEAEQGGDERKYRAADAPRPLLSGGRRLRSVRDGDLGEELDLFRRQQDEYCEWFVERRDGAISRVQFTCEGPEYWRFLATGTTSFFEADDERREITSGDPELLLALYREHIGDGVELEDLIWQHDVAAFDGGAWTYYAHAGEYNEINRWNTTHGAMHLTHRSNTLQAEVQLAADATILRDAEADARALACCAGFGDVNRSSDPLIGLAVNQQAAAGKSVTLADPIGLYMSDFNAAALSDPAAWRVVRGSEAEGRVLRAELRVPAGGLSVGGVPLEYGGQVAEQIQMILIGLVAEAGDGEPPVRACAVSCCVSPERSDIAAVVEPGQRCSEVRWAALAPYLPPEPGAPRPAGTPAPAFAGAGPAGPILPRPAPARAHR